MANGRKLFRTPWRTGTSRVPAQASRRGIRSVPLWGNMEQISHDYNTFAEAVKANTVVFGAVQARQLIFSEATFRWRRFDDHSKRNLFRDEHISLLERPWEGGSTGELLSLMEFDASIAGNSYWTVVDDRGRYGSKATGPGRRLSRMAPDRVILVIGSHRGSAEDIDAKVIGYMYRPNTGTGSPDNTHGDIMLMADEVVHYKPIPDPTKKFLGMSWIQAAIAEIEADKAATRHKGKFFHNGATPNMVITVDKDTPHEEFNEFVEAFQAGHEGVDNAYKTLILSAGADAKVVGADLRQIDFKNTQGAGETRIALASGVPAVILGISEGLSGSSLNSGNFSAARRRFADGVLRPLWRRAASALDNIMDSPAECELTYDDREIAFLREDRKDAADIERIKASTVRMYTDAGYLPDDALSATDTEDITALEGKHSGRFSVQLLRPGDEELKEANVNNVAASTIQSLVSTGRFEVESVVTAVTSGDMTSLVPTEDPPPQAEPVAEYEETNTNGSEDSQPEDVDT